MDIIKYLQTKHDIELNKQQKEAVLTVDGAILLLAVPGSGKTTVMIARIQMKYFQGYEMNVVAKSVFISRRAAYYRIETSLKEISYITANLSL